MYSEPPENRDLEHLWDMRDYALRVQNMVTGVTFDEFSPESMLRMAVERAIELVGEAASRVSMEFREQNPQIPWRAMIGQRIILAHRYGDIDGPILWQTATVEVPKLIRMLDDLLNTDERPR